MNIIRALSNQLAKSNQSENDQNPNSQTGNSRHLYRDIKWLIITDSEWFVWFLNFYFFSTNDFNFFSLNVHFLSDPNQQCLHHGSEESYMS